MINHKIALFILLSVVVYSCKPKPSPKTITKITSRSTVKNDSVYIESPNDFDPPGTSVDYDQKAIDTLYVTDRNGAEVKDKPDSNSSGLKVRDLEQGVSNTKLKFAFGHCLVVLEKKNGWLGVKEYIKRRIKDSGKMLLVAEWEKVYVPEKSAGSAFGVKLLPDELRVIVPENADMDDMPDHKQYLKGYIDLQLVSKAEFDAKKTTAVDYLLHDTTTIRKRDNIIELPCQNGITRFRDVAAGEDYDVYNYIGQVPFLNKYVISGEYDETESGDYSFVDKKTGKSTFSSTGYPHISYDKKYLATVSNTEDGTTFFELYKITGKSAKLIVTATFYYWVATQDDNAPFWGNDNCFYVPVGYLTIANTKSVYGQYLRIKVL